MEIKDAYSIYDFFGQLDFLGGIVLGFLIALIACYFARTVIVKLMVDSKKRIVIVSFVGSIVFISIVVITIIAHHRSEEIHDANAMKSFMTVNNMKLLSYHRIVNEVSLSSDQLALEYDSVSNKNYKTDLSNRVSYIKDLTDKFPNEFCVWKMTDPDKEYRPGDYAG